MSSERQANLIKVAAVAASATRWIGALAASEGLYIPAEWIPVWRIMSFIMAAAMAAVEALAFSYALRAWRYMRPDSPQAKRMMALIVLAAVTFVAVMTPSIVAYVQHAEIDEVLAGFGLWAWGMAVTLSTIVVLMMVGYAQGRMSAQSQGETKPAIGQESSGPQTASPATRNDAATRALRQKQFVEVRQAAANRNGAGPMTVGEIRGMFPDDPPPERTAYNWLEKLEN